ncbi:MAG: exosortase C-terminal domain/associated protein EpsI [Erythrobacter sp.]
MITRRQLIVSGAMLGGGGLGLMVHPAMRSRDNQRASANFDIPDEFGAWRSLPASRIILPPDDALSQAAYQQQLVKAYSDGLGPPVTVVAAYGSRQTYALQLHRPEICYPASGFSLLAQSRGHLDVGDRSIAVGWITARRGTRIDRIVYWTRIADEFVDDIWRQRLTIARRAVAGELADGMLIRISTESLRPEEMDARLARFASGWSGALSPRAKALVWGGL